MRELSRIVIQGFPIKRQEMPLQLRCYWEFRYSIYAFDGVLIVKDGVLMVKYRVLIPPCLRQEILEGLHAAHQCVVAMTYRAQIAFICLESLLTEETHCFCGTCNRMLLPTLGICLKNPKSLACHLSLYVSIFLRWKDGSIW